MVSRQRAFAAVMTMPVALALAACGGEAPEHHQHEPMEEDFRTVEQGVRLSNLNRGCSTSGTQGLSRQLLDEMACLSNGALVKVSHPNITPTSSRVHMYLSPEGKRRLRAAAGRKHLRINSGLRTIAEQYVLWRGCSVAATPGTSNHETGRAIDVDNWSSAEHVLESEGFSHPLPSSDPVHFVAPGKDLRKYSILAFQKLWNANNPNDQIAEDGVTGPATLARLAKAPAGGFQTGSVCSNGSGGSGGENNDDAEYDAALSVTVDGGSDRVAGGSSSGKPDFLPGERFTSHITLENTSDTVWRGVRVGYAVGKPFLKIVDYQIQDDHPAHDQMSWGPNDANDHPENPAASQLGSSGSLYLYAMSPGESKRVVLTVEATEYSFGRGISDHPDVRGWLWHVDNVYSEQRTFRGEATDVNEIGRRVRSYVETDVFDRDQWLFRGGKVDDDEGWSAYGSHDGFKINTDKRTLTVGVDGAGGGLESPAWTRIDADRFDQLVLTTRSHEGPHTVALYFRDGDGSFSEDRAVRFRAPGDGTSHRHVIPIGEHPAWSGEMTRLRIVPFDDEAPSGGEVRWFGVDSLYAQSSTSRETSGRPEYAGDEPVELIGDGDTDPQNDDSSSPPTPDNGTDSGPGTGSAPRTPDDGSDASPSPTASAGADQRRSSIAQTQATCSTTGGRPVGGTAALLFLLVALRRASRP